MVDLIAIEVCRGWQQPTYSFLAGHADRAAALWSQVRTERGATFRVIAATGEEFGTRRPGDVHGIAGLFTERCSDCGLEFKALRVGAPLCPGCELLNIGEVGAL